jgi:hypothetical protein
VKTTPLEKRSRRSGSDGIRTAAPFIYSDAFSSREPEIHFARKRCIERFTIWKNRKQQDRAEVNKGGARGNDKGRYGASVRSAFPLA